MHICCTGKHECFLIKRRRKKKQGHTTDIRCSQKNAMRAVAVEGSETGKQVHLFHDKSDILVVG